MSAWPALLSACARLSALARKEHVGWKVVCPRRVPRVSDPFLGYAGGLVAQNNLKAGYGFGATSDAANGYGHWTLDSGARRTLLRFLYDVNTAGKSADSVSGPQPLIVDGRACQIYRIAPGTSGYANHVAIVWTIRARPTWSRFIAGTVTNRRKTKRSL